VSNRRASICLLCIPPLILFLGLGLTYALQGAARDAARHALHDEFDFRVNEIVQNIHTRMAKYEQVLEGTAGLFAASVSVERDEFADYVQSLKIGGKYPGIQGVGFSQWVPAAEKSGHIAKIRAEGFPRYDIRPAGTRDAYTAIVYLEPFDWRNQRAFGYDMHAEPVRRAAMEKARDAGDIRISGKVQLVQEAGQDIQPGFLMYLPVYRAQAPRQTLDERRANLIGWVYAPFRMGDLMKGILGEHYGEISAALDLEIYDGGQPDARALMFDSGGPIRHAATGFHAVKAIPLLGHQWTLGIHSHPAFDARLNSDKANLIALAGAVGSVSLALVLWLLVTGRERALAMAEGMTADLRQGEARQKRLNRALRLLSDCNMALVHADEEQKLLAEICRLCVERGGYLMVWVGYAEQDEAKTVRPIAQSGYENGYLNSIRITWADTELGRGPTGTAIRSGLPCINQNVLTNPKMAPWREAAIQRGYQSSISLPLSDGDTVLGALTMYAHEADAFDPEELRLLKELASDLSFGIVTLRAREAHAAAKEKLAFLAQFDPLTHLPNRLLLRDRFEQAALIAENDDATMAMLYLDLDNFKQINDSLGHEAGDRVLVAAVARLQQCITAVDTLSRLSGDEFVVLLAGVRDTPGIAGVANAVREVFAEPLVVEGHALNVSFSVGISLFPADGKDFDTLLKCADTAVESAKAAGRNTYSFFTREMNADLQVQTRLAGDLSRALRQNEFLLHYQPQIDLRDGRIIGAEALVRWQHPVDGLISPARFIPLAERSGHIVQIGEWVLNEACRQARRWMDLGLEPPLVVAVNFSAAQFKRGNVLEMVSAALAATGLPANCLELELTESILLQDIDATMETLRGLKALGAKLSIDDFGTGYSSLSYLKRLEVDKLKIDQSFVRDMLADGDGASIVKAIIQLGHILQLEVISEGVETEAQLAFLRGSDCDAAQGYLFSPPVPAEAFAQLVQNGFHMPA
jgi:diguanylate cyclase (GGDEF)-like protein